MNFKKLTDKILNIIFPDNLKCHCCSKEMAELNNSTYLCEECYSNLPVITGKVCLRCGEPINSEAKYCLRCKTTQFSFSHAYSFGAYAGNIKQLIHNFKFNNKPYLSKCFASMLNTTYVLNIIQKHKIDAVTYVPLSIERFKERGYNQSELLAKDFCKISKLPFYKNLLVKVKNTKPQANLNMNERKTNLKNAFEVTSKSIVKNKTFLLIDDIFTTGSSCEECAETLIKAGAYEVIVLTVAHTILNNVKEK